MCINLNKWIVWGILFSFLGNSFILPSVYAQEPYLPVPGQMVTLSPAFSPPVLKGIKLDPNNPFRFHFYVDRGDDVSLRAPERRSNLKAESAKLIKYFLASLTIPEKDLWVNLSPYEKDRIVPQEFGQTEMGRDLLAQDYMLKQITASLIYPESQLGKEFWKRVYDQAQAKYGTTEVPINTFNKVWVVPEKAVVYENGGVAFVLENHLKVILEQDYLALEKNLGIKISQIRVQDTSQIGNQIVREIVIPALTKEVNEGKNFSQLRQAFYSLILATWYKKKIKDSLINKVYRNQNKISGVKVSAENKNKIYQEYLKAFKKGVFNYIREEDNPNIGQNIPRKYFSGGWVGSDMSKTIIFKNSTMLSSRDFAQLGTKNIQEVDGFINFDVQGENPDNAMLLPAERVWPAKSKVKRRISRKGSVPIFHDDAMKVNIDIDENLKPIQVKTNAAMITFYPDEGDTWERIARIIGISTNQLRQYNEDTSKNELEPGIPIQLPLTGVLAEESNNIDLYGGDDLLYLKVRKINDPLLSKENLRKLILVFDQYARLDIGFESTTSLLGEMNKVLGGKSFYSFKRYAKEVYAATDKIRQFNVDDPTIYLIDEVLTEQDPEYNEFPPVGLNTHTFLALFVELMEKDSVFARKFFRFLLGFEFFDGNKPQYLFDREEHKELILSVLRYRLKTWKDKIITADNIRQLASKMLGRIIEVNEQDWDALKDVVSDSYQGFLHTSHGSMWADIPEDVPNLITIDIIDSESGNANGEVQFNADSFMDIFIEMYLAQPQQAKIIYDKIKAQINPAMTHNDTHIKIKKADMARKGEQVDHATITKGGIDFNPAQMSMQIKKNGQDFAFDFNGTQIDAAQVIGARFTILTMKPVINLPMELGLTNQKIGTH